MSPRAPRSSPNLALPEDAEVPEAFFPLAGASAPLHWLEIFGREAPVELEIGCGNGRFLSLHAPLHKEINFFAIEIAAKYALLAARRMDKREVGNVRVSAAEANEFLERWVAPGSLQAMHIYFSDPWPKRRHARRRLFQYSFLNRVARAVRENGMVYIRTDVDWYFADILTLFVEHPLYEMLTFGEQTEFPQDDLLMTGFESKALRQGRRVFFLTLRRCPRVKSSLQKNGNVIVSGT